MGENQNDRNILTFKSITLTIKSLIEVYNNLKFILQFKSNKYFNKMKEQTMSPGTELEKIVNEGEAKVTTLISNNEYLDLGGLY